jgi:hypothetical protein
VELRRIIFADIDSETGQRLSVLGWPPSDPQWKGDLLRQQLMKNLNVNVTTNVTAVQIVLLFCAFCEQESFCVSRCWSQKLLDFSAKIDRKLFVFK